MGVLAELNAGKTNGANNDHNDALGGFFFGNFWLAQFREKFGDENAN